MTFALLAVLVLVTWVEGGPQPPPKPPEPVPTLEQDWMEQCDINTLDGVWKEPICDSRSI